MDAECLAAINPKFGQTVVAHDDGFYIRTKFITANDEYLDSSAAPPKAHH